MRRRIPPLNSLRAFEALGRHGKLADAAEELCVTLSAVSRHIAIMERYVGFDLFTRHPRGFALTEKGEKYQRSVTETFDRLDVATAQLLSREDRPKLSVRVFTTFASEWLVPRLTAFIDDHPEIDFRLSSAVTSDHIDREDSDICIRRGPIGSDMEADLLYYAEYFPVCSPALLTRAPGLRTPHDLLQYTLLNTTAQMVNWNSWLEYAKVGNVDFSKGLHFDNASLAFRAAREGVGVALGQRYYLIDDLANGTLVAPFPHALKSRNAFYMVTRRRRAEEPHVLAFRQWLMTQIEETQARSTLVQGLPTRYVEVH